MGAEKWLPIGRAYEDLLSPAAQEMGDSFRNVVKTARFVLAPIDFLAAYQDRFQRYLRRISEKVTTEDLVLAPSEVTGKSLEGMRYLSEDSPLTEMFLNLLATSIERDRAFLAHPSFPAILSSLCRDEALILYYCKTFEYFLAYSKPYREEYKKTFHHPQNISLYIEHIVSLGLVFFETKRIPFREERDLNRFNSSKTYFMSELGKMFIQACIRDDMNLGNFQLSPHSLPD
ncbi:MAG: DUF4393 domain-containing protein [Planctomycetaceae bacterium]|nr:DUF4393 domain-containing protein [Planctomycetaceae bacterium]